MSRKIFVTSDTHLGHENVLKFTDDRGELVRGKRFHSTKEMDECILDNWNKVVRPGDIVYHLGDVFFGSEDYFKKLWPKFNGKKRLVIGNHDNVRFLSSGAFFSKVMLWRMFPEFNCILSHVPIETSSIRVWDDYGKPSVNIHGHIHQKDPPTERHVNVSVERTNYTPVNLEELTSSFI